MEAVRRNLSFDVYTFPSGTSLSELAKYLAPVFCIQGKPHPKKSSPASVMVEGTKDIVGWLYGSSKDSWVLHAHKADTPDEGRALIGLLDSL